MFWLPTIYKDCNKSEETCRSLEAEVLHEFDNYNPGTKNMASRCIGTKPGNGLPYWYAEVDGYRIEEVPDCYDPTYCETDPPVPPNAEYKKPKKGELKYGDGVTVDYKCPNIRE